MADADTLHWSDARAEIHKVVVGPMDNNVFVLRCRESGEGVLLDAANEHDLLLELCEALDVRTVLETHGHDDHIQAVPAIREAGYQVGVTAADAAMKASIETIGTPIDRSMSFSCAFGSSPVASRIAGTRISRPRPSTARIMRAFPFGRPDGRAGDSLDITTPDSTAGGRGPRLGRLD
jgi:glyoxylase-like metal-dependent hydrolase (beta-lactamase superfamily II)